MSVLGKPVVRAAVYTRKSSDEGLDQEFNSLDAHIPIMELHLPKNGIKYFFMIPRVM